MKKLNKVISSVLAFVFLFATVAGILPVLEIRSHAASSDSYEPGDQAKGYINQKYSSALDKITTDPYMQLYASHANYKLYANRYTGEICLLDTLSGQVLTSNPYNIGDGYDSNTVPMELLSQLELKFKDKTGTSIVYNSYEWAAARGQIYISAIKNGLRVDYTIGDTTTRYLVPNGISQERFESLIIAPAQKKIVESFRELIYEKVGYYENENGDVSYDNEERIEVLLNAASKISKYSSRNSSISKYGVGWHASDVINYILNYEYVTDAETSDILYGYGEYGDTVSFDEWRLCVYDYYKIICSESAENIGKNFTEFSKMHGLISDYLTLREMYVLQDPANAKPVLVPGIVSKYPGTYKGTDENGDPIYLALYALDSGTTNKKKRTLQNTISKYAPEYTMDMMFEDEEETKLEPEIEINPVFRLTLEYDLTNTGMTVTLPANTISYDETRYTVEEIKVLPYFGATPMVVQTARGAVTDSGYIFYPDGSGAVIEYSDFVGKNITVNNPIYGEDYTFHSLTGSNQESIKMPVYGAVSDAAVYYCQNPFFDSPLYLTEQTYLSGTFTCKILERTVSEKVVGEDGEEKDVKHYEFFYLTDTGNEVMLPYDLDGTVSRQYFIKNTNKVFLDSSKQLSDNVDGVSLNASDLTKEVTQFYSDIYKNGYFTVIEDGASLCDLGVIINSAAGNNYASVFPTFTNLPQDSFDLSDAKNGASGTMFSVVSETKYLGKFKMNIFMLTDESKANTLGRDYYSSYNGMANVYRDYLTDSLSGILSFIEDDEFYSDLPLYIETFGVMETLKKFLTIPITVNVPLTSFEDIRTMYGELESIGIKNVKFKMTGYANGGMNARYPVKLKWERAAGGKSGFRKLVSYAAEKAGQGMAIFPEFEVSYIKYVGAFDGIRYQKVASKTIDNRYASKHTYDPSTQTINTEESSGIIVSTTWLSKLYDKLNRKYLKYDNKYISLGSVGSDLASDYNRDEPVLREQSLQNVVAYLAKVSENYQIMSEGGNIYALKYLTYLLKAPIDSSHYRSTSFTVPFFGMVMHSLVNYAGSAFNEEGNPDYTILRSIESGASLYFILSYQNTNLMKDDIKLSHYYSVNYDIWSKDYVYDEAGNYCYKHTDGQFYPLTLNSDFRYYYTVNGENIVLAEGYEPEKYLEGGDICKYYQTLNRAIGSLQSYLITEHKVIAAERVIPETEITANRERLEKEYIEKLKEYVSNEQTKSNSVFRTLRDFYINAVDFIANEMANADLTTAKNENDPAIDLAGGDAKYVEQRTAVRKQELLADYDLFITKLSNVSENAFKRDLKVLTYLSEIRNADPDYLTANVGSEYAQGSDEFIGAFKAKICQKKISLESGQEIGIAFDRESLLAQACTLMNINDPLTAVLDSENEKYADFRAFVTELDQLIAASTREAKVDICTEAKRTLTVNSELFGYQSSYRYFSSSYMTDSDYSNTDYTIHDGSVVMVTYTKDESRVSFILNYNMFTVSVNIKDRGTEEIKPLSFIKITEGGE